jgi:wyosine [tRNA(Phe)-imidazoG37] synthetase (radical SAM superfamily)
MKRDNPQLLVADKTGKIYPIPEIAACGMKAGLFFKLSAKDLIELPSVSELFIMPDRTPIGYDKVSREFIQMDENPYSRKPGVCFPVSAFISPGYTITYNTSYIEKKGARLLPLFSYAAVCLYKNKFHVAAMRVDKELRQDLRFMGLEKIKAGIKNTRRLFPRNRLFRHLERCALCYSCPAAKNLFLQRYEAPLPTSPYCNSRCIGCISYQPDKRCAVTQPRIKFIPKPEEIAEVALFHMKNVKDPVVSFGQGCEGEPLLAGNEIEKAIKIIRAETKKGVINLNTNASLPDTVKRLFDAGLNSIRVSLNSSQKIYYDRYYRPNGYVFEDVIKSIREAKRSAGFVSINYLSMPGFTDSKDEFKAFCELVDSAKVDMVQLRNLNIDPADYFRSIRFSVEQDELLGIREAIKDIRAGFPRLMIGYFNPSRKRMNANKKIVI